MQKKVDLNERNSSGMDNNNLIVPKKSVLQLLPGGKPPPGSDWLSSLPKGTTFLSQNRGMVNGILDQWTITWKTDKSVRLTSELNQTIMVWVVPKDFCANNILHEILEQGTEDDPGTEE